MGIQNRSHTVTFSFSQSTDAEEIISALQNGVQAIGGKATVSVSHYAGDQREPGYTTFTLRPKR